MTGLVFLLTVLFVGSYASHCCFPRQYEAKQGIVRATFTNGQMSVMQGILHYWFDAESRREAYHENIDVDGHLYNIVVIEDYNITNTKYVITDGTRCTKKSLTPFKEGCVPDWAPSMIKSNYGTQESGSTFNVYNNTGGGVTSFLMTSDDCFPMLDVSVSPHGSSPYMETVLFYNFTVGITDQTVFDIPAVCGPPTNIG